MDELVPQEAVEAMLGAGAALDDDEGTPKTPDPYADLKAINERITRTLENDRLERSQFEKEWFRNILFYLGCQHVIWDSGRWRQKRLPGWYPKVVTNKFAEKVNDFVSQLSQGRAPIRYLPSTDDVDDVATAEIGEAIREVIYAEARLDEKQPLLAAWLVMTGNAFLIPHYDMSEEYGTRSVPALMCVDCEAQVMPSSIQVTDGAPPVCPKCGSSKLAPSADESETFPLGAVAGDVVSPFEIRLDQRIPDMERQRRFVRICRYDLELAKEQWPDHAGKMDVDTATDLGQHYLDSLSAITSSYGASGIGRGASEAGSDKSKKTTVFKFYELPSEKFPEGLYAVRVGRTDENIVEAGPLRDEYGAGARKGQKYLPLVHFGGEVVPGRFWRKTRMDDVVSLQMWRNTIESALRLTTQRMANAVWLMPKGSGVDTLTGEPGLVVEYNPIAVGGTTAVKPERLEPALNGVQALVGLLNKIDDSIERVTGTFFLGGGDAPPGITAASALAYLGERANRTIAPMMREWAKGWKRFEEMALELARGNWDDERLLTIAGKNKRWEVTKFSTADLQGAVNMRIDYESLFPKSQATERATIVQLIQLGVVNPQDPEQQWRILEKFGETELRGSFDIDVTEARKENEKFMESAASGTPYSPKVVPLVQNSQVHMMVHADLAKTDEFKELPEEMQALWLQHIQDTMADVMARMAMESQLSGTTEGKAGAAEEEAGGEAMGPPDPMARKGDDASGDTGEMNPESAGAGPAREGAAQGIRKPGQAKPPQGVM